MPSAEPEFVRLLLSRERRASKEPSAWNYSTQDNATLTEEKAFDYAPWLVWELEVRVPSGAASAALLRFGRRPEKEFRIRAGSDPFKLKPRGDLGTEFHLRPQGASTVVDLFVRLRRRD